MIIAQISDTHIFLPSSNNEQRISEKRIQNLKECVKGIKSLKTTPDVILHTGDVTHNGTIEEYKIVHNILGDLKIPIFYTPGNRDNRKNLYKIFNQKYNLDLKSNFHIYLVELSNLNIISMDTHCRDSNKGELSYERLAIFSNLLKKSKNIPTAVFMHHPPFNVSKSSSVNIEFETEDLVFEFIDILKDNKPLIGLFCGHIHRNFEIEIGNFSAYTMPSIALDLSWGKNKEQNSNRPQYLVHTYSKNSGFKTERKWV